MHFRKRKKDGRDFDHGCKIPVRSTVVMSSHSYMHCEVLHIQNLAFPKPHAADHSPAFARKVRLSRCHTHPKVLKVMLLFAMVNTARNISWEMQLYYELEADSNDENHCRINQYTYFYKKHVYKKHEAT